LQCGSSSGGLAAPGPSVSGGKGPEVGVDFVAIGVARPGHARRSPVTSISKS